jgi:serine/threonine protein kinase
MNTLDDWPRVKQMLGEALARQGTERQAYLEEACGTDAALRTRIDTLLAAEDRVGSFLETPAASLLDPPGHQDLSGRAVGSCQLISRLGSGGMGEVYLAHDTRLDRPVAVKFLSAAFSADRNRLRRFHQEARTASSLSHPHIVVVHDFGEMDGRPYMVTEFIDGETLRQRLRRGPLPMQDVADIGVQISSALAAAHARGLVHRDVKPENIMVRPDGYAKVLDFGLAKLAIATQPSAEIDAASGTQSGMVVGTPRYMSPEQARGLDLDARSDVWSLGVVLYEMATGGLPFAEKREIPPGLLRIICKALDTVRDQRYQSADELCADLKVLRDSASRRADTAGAVASPSQAGRAAWPGPRRLALVGVAAIVLGALVSVALIRGKAGTDPADTLQSLAVLPFDNVSGDEAIDYLRLALADEVATALTWSPSLAVRPMAASRKLGNAGANPEEAGRQLRVGGIVTGHFSRHASELRVTVEAVAIDGNRLLWRETIAAPEDDAIALRDRLTLRIRDGLLPALGTTATAASTNRPENAEAYAIYLKSLAISSDPEPNREAIALLERASAMDPKYADAWASLARRYYFEGHYGGGGSQALRQSEAAARQALTQDPAHTAAAVQFVTLQVEAGRLQDAYDGALKLVDQRPHSGVARFAMSYVLRYGGLFEESARECERAISRDPGNPLFRSCVGPFMVLARYDRALDFIRLDSGSEWSKVMTRLLYLRMGRRSDAVAQHERLAPEYLRGMAPGSIYGLLTRCLAGAAPDRDGRLSDEDVRTFLSIREDPEPLYFWASDLVYCGYTDPAVTLLREAIRRNYCGASAIEVDSAFAALRSRTEYSELLGAARACRARFREHVSATPQMR